MNMKLTALQLDALKELINIGVGNGAHLLNRMLDKPIALKAIDVKIINKSELKQLNDFDRNTSIVHMGFEGILRGRANLIFPNQDAVRLLSLIAPWLQVDTSIGQVKKNVLTEVGNILINGVIGSVSNQLNLQSSYSLPQYHQGDIEELIEDSGTGRYILANTQYDIESEKITGSLLIFFELESIQVMQKYLDALTNKSA